VLVAVANGDVEAGRVTDWAELVHVQDDRDVFQASPEDLPVIDIRSL